MLMKHILIGVNMVPGKIQQYVTIFIVVFVRFFVTVNQDKCALMFGVRAYE